MTAFLVDCFLHSFVCKQVFSEGPCRFVPLTETLVLPEPLPLLLFLPVPFFPGITFIIDVCAFWVLEELAYLPEVFGEFWEVLGMPTNFAPLDVIMVFPEVMAFSSFLAHLVMSLCNHALSMFHCHCCHHCQHCCHCQHLCTALPVISLIIEASYLTNICSYVPNICI